MLFVALFRIAASFGLRKEIGGQMVMGMMSYELPLQLEVTVEPNLRRLKSVQPGGGATHGGGQRAGGAPHGGGPPAGGAPHGGGPPAGGAPHGGGPPAGGAPQGGGPPAGGAPHGGAQQGGAPRPRRSSSPTAPPYYGHVAEPGFFLGRRQQIRRPSPERSRSPSLERVTTPSPPPHPPQVPLSPYGGRRTTPNTDIPPRGLPRRVQPTVPRGHRAVAQRQRAATPEEIRTGREWVFEDRAGNLSPISHGAIQYLEKKPSPPVHFQHPRLPHAPRQEQRVRPRGGARNPAEQPHWGIWPSSEESEEREEIPAPPKRSGSRSSTGSSGNRERPPAPLS